MSFVNSINLVTFTPCGIMGRVWNLIVIVLDIAFLNFEVNKILDNLDVCNLILNKVDKISSTFNLNYLKCGQMNV